MEKDKIELKDQELITKFRTLIQDKKKLAKEKQPPEKIPFRTFLVLGILVVSGLVFLLNQSPDRLSASEKPQQQAPTTMEISASPNAPNPPAAARNEPGKETETRLPDSDPMPPDRMNGPQVNKTKITTSSEIAIKALISCSGVKNRQHSPPETRFSLSQGAAPTIWMEVLSKKQPFTLTHVYYCNSQKYCEVPLPISYPRMRTWSSVTLGASAHIGRWKVEVVDDGGAVLDQIEFSVIK